MSDRPIFVVGFQRSGTTLLQSLLGAHPHIAAPPEIHFFFRIHDLQDYWGDLHDDDRAARVVRELVDAPLGMLDGCGFDAAVLTHRFLGTDRSYRALLATLLDDFAGRAGKPRWSEKTPHQRPAQIWSLFPDAQVVHIVRDPREAVASAVAAWPHRVPARTLARRWREFVLATVRDGAAAASGGYLQVRYEDLAANPEKVLDGVCAFLGEELDEAMLARAGRPTAGGPARTPWQSEATAAVRAARPHWRSRLGARDRARVTAAVHDVLTTFGYPPAPRRLVVAGRALAALDARRDGPDRGPAAAPLTPEQRYAAVKSFLADREAAAASAVDGT